MTTAQATNRPLDAESHTRSDLLQLSRLSKSYGADLVLDDVSLSVAEGEFVSLLGPSGSGKTTTLMSIAGFVDVDAGSILLDGSDLRHVPAHRRNIGMVFQNYALFPHLSVLKNVMYPLKLRGIKGKAREEQAQHILEVVGLRGFSTRSPAQLSGGQQQRVALARAMVFGPRLLLMDEPLGALDKNLRVQMQMEITRISRELNATTIYVTHDQDEAMTMSDRIAVYADGRIRQCGTPSEVYERPNSIFVAEFLGESNVIRGRADAGTFRSNAGAALPYDPSLAIDSGDGCALVLRPERVRLSRMDESFSRTGDQQAVLQGVTRDISYRGADRRFVIDTQAGLIIVQEPVVSHEVHLTTGDEVTVSWSTSAASVLADEV